MKELKWFVLETKHLTRAYTDFGWGNGYVCIPKGHPCFGMDYDTIHNNYDHIIQVNGGLSFSEPASELKKWPIPEGYEDSWVVGFDTAHLNDSLAIWPKHMVEAEAQRLKTQLESITL